MIQERERKMKDDRRRFLFLFLIISMPKWRRMVAPQIDSAAVQIPPPSLFRQPTGKRSFVKRSASTLEQFKSYYFSGYVAIIITSGIGLILSSRCLRSQVQPLIKLCEQIDQAVDNNLWLEKLVCVALKSIMNCSSSIVGFEWM
jgi:hypothetical protein